MAARVFPIDAVAGSPEYDGRSLRQSLSSLTGGVSSSRPFGGQSGVRAGTPASTLSISGTTWNVGMLSGIMDVEASAQAGGYFFAFDESVSGSINAAHATYTRWDGIFVQLSDPAEGDGSSVPKVEIVYVAGTPAASPAMPSTPARSMLLGKLVVPKTGSGSPSAVWLAPVLSSVPIFSTADDMRSAMGAALGGALAFTTDTHTLWTSNGTTWSPVGIPTFASRSAMTAAIPTGTSGQLAFTTDYQILWAHNGTDWIVQNTPSFASTSARESAIPSPTKGIACWTGSGSSLTHWQHDGTGWLADVEVVTNSNGTAWKYADGRMICMRRWAGTLAAASTNYGSSGLTISQIAWTFPVAFTDVPAISVGECQISSGASWSTIASTGPSPTSTSATIRAMDITARAAGTAFTASATAIGRWK